MVDRAPNTHTVRIADTGAGPVPYGPAFLYDTIEVLLHTVLQTRILMLIPPLLQQCLSQGVVDRAQIASQIGQVCWQLVVGHQAS